VDREQTHAVSMIINVDQSEDLESGKVEPWRLDIDDHQTGESRLVTMRTGDMVGGWPPSLRSALCVFVCALI